MALCQVLFRALYFLWFLIQVFWFGVCAPWLKGSAPSSFSPLLYYDSFLKWLHLWISTYLHVHIYLYNVWRLVCLCMLKSIPLCFKSYPACVCAHAQSLFYRERPPWLWLIASIETQQTSWIRVLREETVLPPPIHSSTCLCHLPAFVISPLSLRPLWRCFSGKIFSFETRQHFKCLSQWVLSLLIFFAGSSGLKYYIWYLDIACLKPLYSCLTKPILVITAKSYFVLLDHIFVITITIF